jgi:hypothetical protein
MLHPQIIGAIFSGILSKNQIIILLNVVIFRAKNKLPETLFDTS